MIPCGEGMFKLPKHVFVGSGNWSVRVERGTGIGAAKLVNRRKVYRMMPRYLRSHGLMKACRIAPANQAMPKQPSISESDEGAWALSQARSCRSFTRV